MTAMASTPALTCASAWLLERLGADGLARLSRQGFVHSHALPSGRMCYKLRHRDAHRRQRVLHIGVNPSLAEAVQAELLRRQAPMRRRRLMRELVRDARTLLRLQKH